MKKLLIGVTLLLSVSSFAKDCDCYAEVTSISTGETDSHYLFTYRDVNLIELPYAKLVCMSTVADYEGDGHIDFEVTSNLECE